MSDAPKSARGDDVDPEDDVEEDEKRKGMMRLTDDGELEEVVDEPFGLSEAMPLKRQR